MSTPRLHYRIGNWPRSYWAACKAGSGYLLTPDPNEVTCKSCLRAMAKRTEQVLGARLVHLLTTHNYRTACGLDINEEGVVATMFPQSVSCRMCLLAATAQKNSP